MSEMNQKQKKHIEREEWATLINGILNTGLGEIIIWFDHEKSNRINFTTGLAFTAAAAVTRRSSYRSHPHSFLKRIALN